MTPETQERRRLAREARREYAQKVGEIEQSPAMRAAQSRVSHAIYVYNELERTDERYREIETAMLARDDVRRGLLAGVAKPGPRQCEASGCHGFALWGSTFCAHHDPDQSARTALRVRAHKRKAAMDGEYIAAFTQIMARGKE